MKSFAVFFVSFIICTILWLGSNIFHAVYLMPVFKVPFDGAAYSISHSAEIIAYGDPKLKDGQLEILKKDVAYLQAINNSNFKWTLFSELRSIAIILGLLIVIAWMARPKTTRELA